VTSNPNPDSSATAIEPTPPAAPVTTIGPSPGCTPAVSSSITQSIAVSPAVPIAIAVRALIDSGRRTSHSDRRRWRCV
jgi:hypothetical protein